MLLIIILTVTFMMIVLLSMYALMVSTKKHRSRDEREYEDRAQEEALKHAYK